jgi:hypothetical protein
MGSQSANQHGTLALFAQAFIERKLMKTSLVLASLLVAAALSGCVVAPVPAARPYYYGQPVMVAPPPPRVEYIGQPPYPGHVWIGGYWHWTGGRHDWVPGRWEAPRSGYYWKPHRWEQDGQYWRQTGGQWERHDARRDRHDEHHGHGD